MDLMVKYVFLVLQACAIVASSVVLQGSSEHDKSPSVSFSTVRPVIERSPHRVTQEEQITSNSLSPTAQPNASPHFESASGPQLSKGLEPSSSLNEPPPSEDSGLPPNAAVAGPITSIPESSPPSPPVMAPIVPVQIAPPPKEPPQNPPPEPQVPPSVPQEPPEPVASPPSKLPVASPSTHPTLPLPPPNLPGPIASPIAPNLPNLPVPAELPPSTLPISPPAPPTSPVPPNLPAPVASPPSKLPINPPPNLPAPVASPPSTLPINSPPSPPTVIIPPPSPPAPLASSPSTLPINSPPSPPTFTMPPPNSPAPVASPPSTLPINSPPSPPTSTIRSIPPPAHAASPPSPSTFTTPPPSPPVPAALPPHAPRRNLPPPRPTFAPPPFTLPVPVALPPSNSPENLHPISHNSSMPSPNLPEPHISPVSTPRPSTNNVSSPPNRTTNIAPTHRSKDPIVHKAPSSYNHAPPPHSSDTSPPTKSHPPPSLPPLYPPPPPGRPKSKPSHNTGPPPNPGSAVPPVDNSVSPAISPPSSSPTIQTTMPIISPKTSPSSSPPRIPKPIQAPIISPKTSPSSSPPRIPKPIQALPPPPPNEDCSSITCQEPLTNTPPGTPCNCVLPMQVELSLGVALYTFFPLVSELAFEIAAGVFIRSSQVRIMGANADNQDPEKTIVIMDLVPLGEKFDNFTAYVTAQRLWLKQVVIKSSLFGDYEVLYVKYPGLPPSPPMPSSSNGVNGEPYGHGNNGRTIKPLGVDVSNQRHNGKLNGGVIAVISFSAVAAVVLISVAVWVLLVKRRDGSQPKPTQPATLLSLTKSSGIGGSIGSGPTSDSLSFRSSVAYTGSAKTFSSSDMEKATNNFDESGVLGEGGFGRVYGGVLEDGTKVAVKVLKRDDQQGGREFLAEVEMLSRLHHRNLVRLIGICTEERNRCLVYELIANGSVESHLHGIDKETAPLDWAARLKIALGAACGLAYLHEDSSPRVIHRDFKSSNILLEHDFTPKVSDFGLARTALDEENRHISTRVMGTFGYVAPEYAMTGHLLVKSDVYSYGVVLLELLTGRKPVDMSMPPGQENLVAWARPLLPTQEGLNFIIDPSLSPEVPFDSIAKVAAIASMCVQPEVSHRPFMGEVVQALKLVCNECEETRDLGSRSCSQEDLMAMDHGAWVGPDSSPTRSTYSNYESPLDMESGFLGSGFGVGLDVGSYRMGSSSGPVRPGRQVQLWERMKRFSSGSVSEHGDFLRLLSRSR